MRDPRDAHEDDRSDVPAGLFLSRKGNWFHDGQRVGHVRLEALLTGAVSRDAAGGLIVTTGRDVLPFVAEDTPLFVTSVDIEGEGPPQLVLSDGTREPLSRLVIGPDDRFRAAVRESRFWALFTRSAAQLLEPFFEDDGLSVRGHVVPVTTSQSTSWTAPPSSP